MTALVIGVVLVVVLLGIGSWAGGVALWRRLSRSQLTQQVTQQVRLELAGETARSPAHRAATTWRQTLHAQATHTRRTLTEVQRANGALTDFGLLVDMLERSVSDLDRELALLGRERDPAQVDRVLRSGLGQRAAELDQTATRLREAMSRSISSAGKAQLRELVEATDLSASALAGALDELEELEELEESGRRGPVDWPEALASAERSAGSPAEAERNPMTENAVDQLTCPKCHGAMRRYERSGVVIDQCSDCRGIFLDAGELETIMKAEDAHYQQQAPPAQQAPPPGYPPQQGYPQQGYPQQGYGGGGGFLGGLFGSGHHGGRHH